MIDPLRLRRRIILYGGQRGGGAAIRIDYQRVRDVWARTRKAEAGEHYGFETPYGAHVLTLDWTTLAVAVAGQAPAADAYAVAIGSLTLYFAQDAQGDGLMAVGWPVGDYGPRIYGWVLLDPVAEWSALLDDVQPDPALRELGWRVPNARRRYLIRRRRGDLPHPSTSRIDSRDGWAWLWDPGMARLTRVERIMAAPEYDERRFAYIET